MSTSKRFGRLSHPILKGARTPDIAGKRRKAQKRLAEFNRYVDPTVASPDTTNGCRRCLGRGKVDGNTVQLTPFSHRVISLLTCGKCSGTGKAGKAKVA